jgi:hypothetical protein
MEMIILYNNLKTIYFILIAHKRGFKLGRKLNGILLILRLNYNIRYNIITNFKIIKRPLNYILRRHNYKKLINSDKNILDMSKGYSKFSISNIPNVENALKILEDIYREKVNDIYFKKKILNQKLNINLLEKNDYKKHPQVNEFILNDLFLKIAAKYLKNTPIIAAVEFWLSSNNQNITQSQKWHIDGEDKKQIKFFIPIVNISNENGPTQFVDKINTRKILNSYNSNKEKYLSIRSGDLSARIPDDLVEEKYINVGLLDKFQCLALDTCSCLHMGSRIESSTAKRLVLMIQFIPANCHREPALDYPPIQLKRNNNYKINKLILDL